MRRAELGAALAALSLLLLASMSSSADVIATEAVEADATAAATHAAHAAVRSQGSLTVVAVSDTHGAHRRLGALPPGDVLVHAGDFEVDDLAEFNAWLAEQPFVYKIVVPGNMDYVLEGAADPGALLPAATAVLTHGQVTLDCGLTVFGSSYTPKFVGGWQLASPEEQAAHWADLPAVDLLVTHGPPRGVLDRSSRGQAVGDADLMAAVQRVRPQAHIFGHVHHSYGRASVDGIAFVNAAQFNGVHNGDASVVPMVVEVSLGGR